MRLLASVFHTPHTHTHIVYKHTRTSARTHTHAHAHNHLCFRLSGTKMFHHELRFCWAVRPTLPPLMLLPLPLPLPVPSPRSTGVSSSIDEADVIMPLRRRRSIFACHDERRRFSLLTTTTGWIGFWFRFGIRLGAFASTGQTTKSTTRVCALCGISTHILVCTLDRKARVCVCVCTVRLR